MHTLLTFLPGRSRCFTYWQEFSKVRCFTCTTVVFVFEADTHALQCYAQTDNPAACRPQSEDYLECLHHPKEVARAKQVQDEFIRKAEASAREGQKAADLVADGVIVGLGLIRRGQEETK
ncbi:hypothetical protein DXG03_000973 [Asterophora parasitica]|uniref:NADH dehydrogenase [ubiquinone] iron-sulfur protein 5 n=1 Tax=Asterophora parasitica TaxID=117018 RepID=A0A9P7KC10_9AGAR|nr:hypothetical protein DXG03_000973 [Asterophora parasitica]